MHIKVAVPSLLTRELYDADAIVTGGLTQLAAWRKGYIFRDIDEDWHRTRIELTPRFFRDLYRPRVPQLWMVNTCWGMLTKDDQGFGRTGKTWAWGKKSSPFVLYNFGDGLMDAGIKAEQPMVVFGYITPASPFAILDHTMTFFRRPETPDKKVYANKAFGGTLYTMYATDKNQYFRNACAEGTHHAMLQDFTLKVGAPATSFQNCWDTWWSQGKDPTFTQDQYCDKGEPTATETQTQLAACLVKVARKVTNAMLR